MSTKMAFTAPLTGANVPRLLPVRLHQRPRHWQYRSAAPAALPLQQAAGNLSKFITQSAGRINPLRLLQQAGHAEVTSAAQPAAAILPSPAAAAVQQHPQPQHVGSQTAAAAGAAAEHPRQQFVRSNVAARWLDSLAAVQQSSAPAAAAAANARIPSSHDDADRGGTQPCNKWLCVTDWDASKTVTDGSTNMGTDWKAVGDQQLLEPAGSSSSSSAAENGSRQLHEHHTSSSRSGSSSSSSIAYARHLSTVTNSYATASARFESLTWLLLDSQRQQQQLLCRSSKQQHNLATSVPGDGSSSRIWTDSSGGLQLLDQIYNIGQAVGDLGLTAGMQLPGISNLSRAILAMDYARVLNRYYEVHGEVLSEKFWSQLHDFDLQARAIHISTTLDTRRIVHNLLLDQLTNTLGQDMLLPAAAAGPSSGSSSSSLPVPLATAVTNNNIIVNRTDVSSSQSNDSAVMQAAAPSATSSSTSTAECKDTTSSSNRSGLGHIIQGFVGLGGALVIIWAAAGKVVRVILTIVLFAKDLLLHLLLLRSVAAAARALAAAALPQMQLTGIPVVGTKTPPTSGGHGGSSNCSSSSSSGGGGSSSSSSSSGGVSISGGGSSSCGNGPHLRPQPTSTASTITAAAAAAAAAQPDSAGSAGGWVPIPDQLQSALTGQPTLIMQSDHEQTVRDPKSPICSATPLLAMAGCLGLLAMHPISGLDSRMSLSKQRKPRSSMLLDTSVLEAGVWSKQQPRGVTGAAREVGQQRSGQQQQQRHWRSGGAGGAKLLQVLWIPEAARAAA